MRILQEKDREEILRYVGEEPEMNLFFIGDIETFGVESETVNIYVHEERDRWDFLILRFHQYFLLYSRYEDYNAGEAVEFFKGQRPDCISGKTSLLEKIAPAFPQWKIQSTYMSRCNRVADSFETPAGLVIRRLELRDVPEAMGLLSEIQEFSKTYKKSELPEQTRRMEEEMAQGCKAAVGGFLRAPWSWEWPPPKSTGEKAMPPQWWRPCAETALSGVKSISACSMTILWRAGYTTGSDFRSWENTECCGEYFG